MTQLGIQQELEDEDGLLQLTDLVQRASDLVLAGRG
jgi:hypothetical protein